MNWYYVDAGQQAGPVDDTKLAELAHSGKIQADTLVWHEGMPNWTRYAEAASALAAGMPPVTAPSSGGSPAVTVSEADLFARDYEVDIGGCLSRAWEVFKADAGLIIGASVLVYLAIMAASAIPYLSIVLALLFNGPLMGGLWLFYIKKMRNQEVTVGDAFGGFGPKFWQLVLTRLIPAAVALGFVILIGLVAALTVPAILQIARHQDGGLSGIAPISLIPVGVLFLIFIVVMTYLNTCWLFALPLVADKGLNFWPALELSRRVVNKHWWMTFGLLIVASIIGFVGMLACCVGLLVSGPVAFAMIVAHYQKVFGDLAPAQGAGWQAF